MSEEKCVFVIPEFPPTYYNNTLYKYLTIRDSHIKAAGKGVFSYHDTIKEGELIGIYEGEVKDAKDGECVGDYSFTLTKKWYVDARKFPRSYVAMINDAHGSKFNNNCEFRKMCKDDEGNKLTGKDIKICLFALRDIHCGEELYASYGPEYWECESRRHFKKKK